MPHIVIMTPVLLVALVLVLLLLLVLLVLVADVALADEASVLSGSPPHPGANHPAERTAPIPKAKPIDLEFIDITSRKSFGERRAHIVQHEQMFDAKK